MKVRLRVATLGHKPGDVIDVEKSRAKALVANGSARIVKPAPESEED
jgi:hypothetical protein